MGTTDGSVTMAVNASSSNGFLTVKDSGSTFIQETCPPSKLTRSQLRAYYTEVYVIASVFTLAMFGNLCVLLAVWRRRAKRTRMHLFIVHLAVADIFVALFQLLPELFERLLCGFYGGDALCRMQKFMQIVGMYGSTYVLVCTAMDRYLAIKYPMQTFKLSKKRIHFAIAMAWLLALLLSVPQFFFFGVRAGSTRCSMMRISPTGIKIYVTWYFLSVLTLPGIMLMFFYGMIAGIIIQNIRQKRKAATGTRTATHRNEGAKDVGDFAPRASNVKIVSRAKIKTVKMTLVIVCLFTICWTPFFVVQLLRTWGVTRPNNLISGIIHLLASLNSCVNPWVYMGFSGHLIGELKQAFMCGRNRGNVPLPRSFRSTLLTNTAYTSVAYAENSNNTTSL